MDPSPIYRLDAAKLAILRVGRAADPQDPVTHRPFVVGDEIVFCGAPGCGLPMLADTWRATGNRCPSQTAYTSTMRYPEFEGQGPRIRNGHVRLGPRQTVQIVLHPPRVTLPEVVPLQQRIWRAALAEAILLFIAYAGWQIFNFIYYLPGSFTGIFWLLMPFILLFILLPIMIVYIGICLIGGMMLAGGAIWIVINVFAATPAYVDPVERVLQSLKNIVASVRNWF
jgi:hypothetical protein